MNSGVTCAIARDVARPERCGFIGRYFRRRAGQLRPYLTIYAGFDATHGYPTEGCLDLFGDGLLGLQKACLQSQKTGYQS